MRALGYELDFSTSVNGLSVECHSEDFCETMGKLRNVFATFQANASQSAMLTFGERSYEKLKEKIRFVKDSSPYLTIYYFEDGGSYVTSYTTIPAKELKFSTLTRLLNRVMYK